MKNILLICLIFLGKISYGQTTKNNKKMEKTAMEVFEVFGQGMMSGTDSWKDYIANDIKFIGPVDQVNGKNAFIKLNESFMPAIRGNKMKQVVESGNYVITQIEMQVAMESGKTITLDMCEWYEIKDGKIQSMRIYYDAEEFKKEMGMKTN
ncbi:nuclear transport factor 2 family protein [uncultured Maribacter sp.]|uniref:nuclear transport factor 2 family protein n=1 Tax=uncultured Maribacter sp. TaxID=431308 RepID=UPI002626638D|nr:nuclear transport factor 2 family protein [uncultured Maribacter sp.]